MKLEACIETLEEAQIAAKHKIDRVELCSALDLGGLTPSAGLIKSVSEHIETQVMIRPRAGNFVYTTAEMALMLSEIEMAKKIINSSRILFFMSSLNLVIIASNLF